MNCRPHRFPLLSFFAYLRQHPWLLLLTVVLAVAANTTIPITQHLIGLAFRDLSAGDAVRVVTDGLDYSLAWWWVMILIAFTIGRGVVAWMATVSAVALTHRLLHHLRFQVLCCIQNLDLAWHRHHGAGSVITRTTRDGDKVRDALIHGSRMVLETALFLTGVIALMLWYHPSIALVTATALVIAIALMWAQAPLLVRLDRHAGDRYDRLTQDLSEGVSGVRVIKAFSLERLRISAFQRLVEAFAGSSRRAQRASEWRLQMPQLVVAVNHGLCTFIAVWLVSNGALDVGQLTATVMMLVSVVFRIEGLARGFALFYEARASAARIREILDATPSISSSSTAIALPEGPLGMQLEDVGVQIGRHMVLEHCTLTIPAGSTLALVGATGSGKSTLFDLLPRMRDCDRGQVFLINAQGERTAIKDVDIAALRKAVHAVPQEAFLFSASAEHNICLAAPRADSQQLRAALQAAAAEDIVEQLPQGLAGAIGERGTTLSGGQKQRLCLARAILAAPRVLVLDDATSALDTSTEARVIQGLRQVCGTCTVILSTSRLSTVRMAEYVAWLEDGRIRAVGRHEDLVREHREYAALLGCNQEPGR